MNSKVMEPGSQNRHKTVKRVQAAAGGDNIDARIEKTTVFQEMANPHISRGRLKLSTFPPAVFVGRDGNCVREIPTKEEVFHLLNKQYKSHFKACK